LQAYHILSLLKNKACSFSLKPNGHLTTSGNTPSQSACLPCSREGVQMTIYEIIGFSLLFIGILELFLGIILLRNNPRRSPVQKAVTALALFSAAFSVTSGSMYLRASFGMSIDLVARINWIGWFTVPAGLQVLFFLKNDEGRFGRTLGIVLYPLWVLILGLCLFTDLIVAPGYSVIPFVNHYGPLEHAGRLFGTVLAFWLLYECVRLKKSMIGARKAQFNYFFYGLLIFGGGASFTAGFLQLLGGIAFEPGLAAFFSFPWVILTFYACIRYSLFDIRIIVSRTLTVILLFIIVALLQLGTIMLLSPFLGNLLSDLISLSLIGLIFFGTPLRTRVQEWIASIIIKGKYDYQQLLKESTKALVTILDLDDLLAYIISSISKSLRTEKIHLFLKGMDGAYRIQQGHGMAPVPTVDDDSLRWLERTNTVLIRQELAMARSAEESGRLYKALSQTDVELIVPLVYKGQMSGFMTVGKKGGKEPYIQSDIDLLVSMANHAAVAIENARLFDESRRLNNSFQESEAKFRTLAETTSAGIMIHQDEHLIYVNPAAEKITGQSRDFLLTLDFWDVIQPDDRALVKKQAAARPGEENPSGRQEYWIITKSGALRWVNMSTGIIEYQGKPAIIATIFDITDRKDAEAATIQFYEESVMQYDDRNKEEKRHLAEKEKLLRDLHDGIGGITTNISMLAELAKSSDILADIKKTLSTISDLAREGLSEIRNFMNSLDARDMSWQTLLAELRNQGNAMIGPHGLSFDLTSSIDDIDDQPGSLLCLNIFKIYREALTNIIKHAQAKTVKADFSINKRRLKLTIQDDGVGVGAGRVGGRGLANIHARAKDLGGAITLAAQCGTCLTLEIPLPLQDQLMNTPQAALPDKTEGYRL
jgi:PAS domain S-box-containing protein